MSGQRPMKLYGATSVNLSIIDRPGSSDIDVTLTYDFIESET